MENFVKVMKKNSTGDQYLKTEFSRMTQAKLKKGIFVGPKIRQMTDTAFNSKKNRAEKSLSQFSGQL